MLQTFIKITTKLEKMTFFQVFRKTVAIVSVYIGVIEIKDAFIVASNSSLSTRVRALAVARGMCCTGSSYHFLFCYTFTKSWSSRNF